MMNWNLSSAKALQDSLRYEAEINFRKKMAENSAVEASKTLMQTDLRIEELNRKQELQNDYLSKLIELHRFESEANKHTSSEMRFVNWSVLIISIVGTIFTVISFFK